MIAVVSRKDLMIVNSRGSRKIMIVNTYRREKQESNKICKASVTSIEQSFPEVTDNITLDDDVKTTSGYHLTKKFCKKVDGIIRETTYPPSSFIPFSTLDAQDQKHLEELNEKIRLKLEMRLKQELEERRKVKEVAEERKIAAEKKRLEKEERKRAEMRSALEKKQAFRFTVTKPESGDLGLILENDPVFGSRVKSFLPGSVFIETPVTAGTLFESVNGVKCNGFEHTRDLLNDATGKIIITAKRP